MTIWTFLVLLCCPFGVEHTIRFEAPTEVACKRMRGVVAQHIRGGGYRAVVDEKCVVTP